MGETFQFRVAGDNRQELQERLVAKAESYFGDVPFTVDNVDVKRSPFSGSTYEAAVCATAVRVPGTH